jgi:hypothetical protein
VVILDFEDYWDFATKEEKLLADRYPITIEQAVIILTLSNNNFEIAEKACQLIFNGHPYAKVRMMLYKNEIQ